MSTAEIVLINYLNYEQQNLFVLTLVTIVSVIVKWIISMEY